MTWIEEDADAANHLVLAVGWTSWACERRQRRWVRESS